MDCESIMGPYRLWIRKFARGNFGKTEKVLSAQAVFWMRKAIPILSVVNAIRFTYYI